MTKCDRCGEEVYATSMSWFNTDTLCLPCQGREALHPAYAYAKRKEEEAVREGDLNYPGTGLPDGYAEWEKEIRADE